MAETYISLTATSPSTKTLGVIARSDSTNKVNLKTDNFHFENRKLEVQNPKKAYRLKFIHGFAEYREVDI